MESPSSALHFATKSFTASRCDLLRTFEAKPALGPFALVLLIRIRNSFVEIGAQGGRYCESPCAFPCEASALARRFDEKGKFARHLIHFTLDASMPAYLLQAQKKLGARSFYMRE